MRIPPRTLRLPIAVLAALLLLAAFWFIGITESAYKEMCVHCETDRVIVETRVLGILVSQRVTQHEQSFESRIADDLGSPCPHSYIAGLYVKRRGFVLITYFRDEWAGVSLHAHATPTWYENGGRAIVAKMKRRNPTLPDEFRERVLFKSDREYWRRLIKSIVKESQGSGVAPLGSEPTVPVGDGSETGPAGDSSDTRDVDQAGTASDPSL